MTEDRNDILSSMDRFIDKIQELRSIMLGVSLSAVILAPFAIGISLYLITHPRFLTMVENENEFGYLLVILLTGIFVVSGIWLYTGIKQFRSLSLWNNRYCSYLKKKEELDDSISSKFSLDDK